MAFLSDVFQALVDQINPAVTGIVIDGGPLVVQVASGWPPSAVLNQVAQASVNGTPTNLAVVAVYDRKISRNSTRWNPVIVSEVVTQATLTSSVTSPQVIGPRQSTTINLGGFVTPNDAVSAVFQQGSPVLGAAGAAVAIAGATDTPATVAAALAAKIEADPVLSTWVSALAVGASVVLTSLLTLGPIKVYSHTGNTAQRTREIGRRSRSLQIPCWTRTDEARQALCNPIDVLIQSLALNFGVTFPDGTMGRVLYQNDFDTEDATVQNVYRRDFHVTVDYPVTQQDVLYSVLAPIGAFQID